MGREEGKDIGREIWEDPETCEEIWAMTKTWRWGKRHKNRDRTPEREIWGDTERQQETRTRGYGQGEKEKEQEDQQEALPFSGPHPHTHTLPSGLGGWCWVDPGSLNSGLSQGLGIKSQGIAGPQYLQPGDHGGAIPGSKGQALAAGLFQKFMPGEKEPEQELSGVETPSPTGWPPSLQAPPTALFMNVENVAEG